MTEPSSCSAGEAEHLHRVRALLADLRDLAVDVTAGGYTQSTLAMFERDLRRVVPAALGASIRVDLARRGLGLVEIHLLARPLRPAAIASALQVRLPLADRPCAVTVVFYASTARAFSDLSDDLAALLELGPEEIDPRPVLPQVVISPSVAGLDEHSEVNRAIGVLIERGHTVAGARAELEQRAEQSGLSLPEAARLLLIHTS